MSRAPSRRAIIDRAAKQRNAIMAATRRKSSSGPVKKITMRRSMATLTIAAHDQPVIGSARGTYRGIWRVRALSASHRRSPLQAGQTR